MIAVAKLCLQFMANLWLQDQLPNPHTHLGNYFHAYAPSGKLAFTSNLTSIIKHQTDTLISLQQIAKIVQSIALHHYLTYSSNRKSTGVGSSFDF